MAEWQRGFWSTTASGYIGFVARMLLGLVLFRLMFQNFSGVELGWRGLVCMVPLLLLGLRVLREMARP
jgi:hypothetical protein